MDARTSKIAAFNAILCLMVAVTPVCHAAPAALHKESDPCATNDHHACEELAGCVWSNKQRNKNHSRKEQKTYGRHSGANGGSCAMIHVVDRVSAQPQTQKALFENFGFHSTWADIECDEAAFLKDCKDINQHNVMFGNGRKCAWTCSEGCHALPEGIDPDASPYDVSDCPFDQVILRDCDTDKVLSNTKLEEGPIDAVLDDGTPTQFRLGCIYETDGDMTTKAQLKACFSNVASHLKMNIDVSEMYAAVNDDKDNDNSYCSTLFHWNNYSESTYELVNSGGCFGNNWYLDMDDGFSLEEICDIVGIGPGNM